MARIAFKLFDIGLICALALLSTGAHADKAGDALLQKCMQATARARTLQADFTTRLGFGPETTKVHGLLQLQKPNIAHIVMSDAGGDGDVVTHSNGKQLLNLVMSEKQYTSEPPDIAGGNVVRYTYSMEAKVFFDPDLLDRFRSLGTGVKVTGTLMIGGVRCQALQVMGLGKNLSRIYIGPDGIMRGLDSSTRTSEQPQFQESRLTNVRIDASLPAPSLAWSPPKNTRLVQAITVSAESGGSGASPGAVLIQPGKPAPNFSLPLLNSGTLASAAAFRSSKVTLLNFWNYG